MYELDDQQLNHPFVFPESIDPNDVGAAAHLDPGVAQFDGCRFFDNVAVVDRIETPSTHTQPPRLAHGPALALGTDTMVLGYSYPATAWLRDCSFRNNTMQRDDGQGAMPSLPLHDVAVATAEIFIFESGTRSLRVYSAADDELLTPETFGGVEEHSDGWQSLVDYDPPYEDRYTEAGPPETRQTAKQFWTVGIPSGYDIVFKALWQVCCFFIGFCTNA